MKGQEKTKKIDIVPKLPTVLYRCAVYKQVQANDWVHFKCQTLLPVNWSMRKLLDHSRLTKAIRNIQNTELRYVEFFQISYSANDWYALKFETSERKHYWETYEFLIRFTRIFEQIRTAFSVELTLLYGCDSTRALIG